MAGNVGAGRGHLYGLGRWRRIRWDGFRWPREHGFARIEGPPEKYRGVNVNGGKIAEHPASFPRTGKTGGILFVDGTLYARLNLQDGKWPDVNHSLAWSDDRGATWKQTAWMFPKGAGNFKPARFLNFGRDHSGVPEDLDGFVYIYGFRQAAQGAGNSTYLSRVPKTTMKDRAAYEFFAGLDGGGTISYYFAPKWFSPDGKDFTMVFTWADHWTTVRAKFDLHD